MNTQIQNIKGIEKSFESLKFFGQSHVTSILKEVYLPKLHLFAYNKELNLFISHAPITKFHFQEICQSFGVENWQSNDYEILVNLLNIKFLEYMDNGIKKMDFETKITANTPIQFALLYLGVWMDFSKNFSTRVCR